jgi:hypothetical protein
MPQIVVAQNIHGIVLAAENLAVQLNEEGEEFLLEINRLLPLTPHCALLTAGAPEGAEIGNALQSFIQAMPYRLYFLWTKKKLPQLDGDEISYAFSFPRRMGLEFQLNKMCKEKIPLKEIVKKVVEGLERLRNQGEVSSSFSFGMITQEGYQSLNP